MDDAGLAFLAELPERGLDLHPDLHILRLDVDQLRGESDPFVHLDDCHYVWLLHLELGRRIMDDRVRHDRAFALETHSFHLPDGSAAARPADGPRRKVDLSAAPALRADQGVPALGLPPEARDGHISPPARRYGRRRFPRGPPGGASAPGVLRRPGASPPAPEA